jgi:hypothetical protein
MKKLLLFLFTIPTLSFGQIIINQEVVEDSPYTVGDTITIKYTLKNLSGQSDFKYFWLRLQYSNKHLQLVPNSTSFENQQNRQTYFHQWVGFTFIPNPNIGVGELSRQLLEGGYNYVQNPDWNIIQLNVQSVQDLPDGEWVSQKFVIKDQLQFNNIHKLDMADARNSANQLKGAVGSEVLWLSLNNVTGNSSSTKFRVAFPAGYDISRHKIQVVNINDDNTPNYSSIVAILPLDNSGEVTTTLLQTGKKYFAIVTPTFQQPFMDDIVTVTDAYKAFLQISNKGLNMDQNYFTTPIEFKVGNVSIDGDDVFDLTDSYNIFAHVIGVDVSNSSRIPTSKSNSIRFYSGLINGYNQGIFTNIIDVKNPNNVFDFGYSWGGDLDFSHSTPKTVESIPLESARVVSTVKEESTTVVSKIVNSKIELEIKITSVDLAAAQYKIVYDTNKLELEEVIFDCGNTITNFSTPRDNAVIFGSIDNIGTSRIKAGTPYKIIFKPKTLITNTSGLFYVEFAEAVSSKGDKINLTIR